MPLSDEEKKAAMKKLFESAGVVYPEAKIEETKNNVELQKLHEDAKVAYQNYEAAVKRIKDTYDVKAHGLTRVFMYFFNPEDSYDSKKENDSLFASLQTKEGVQTLVNRFVKECMEADVNDLVPTNTEEMAKKFIEDPMKYARFFSVCYIVDNEENADYKIDEPLKSAFKEKTRAVQLADYFRNACEIYASDDWAVLSQKYTDEELLKIIHQTSSGDVYTSGNPDLINYIAPQARIWGMQEDVIKFTESSKTMKEKNWLRDGVSFVYQGETLTRAKLNDKIAKGQVPSLDDVQVKEETTETKEKIEQQKNSLTTDVLDTTIKNTREEKKAEEDRKYEKIAAFHANAFEAAGLPAPDPLVIQKKMENPKDKELHEKTKAALIKNVEDHDRMDKLFPNSPKMDRRLNRIYRYLLDPSDTVEALDRNTQLQALSETEEGNRIIVSMGIKMLLDKSEEFYLPKTYKEAAQRFVDNPQLCNMAFAYEDLMNAMNEDDGRNYHIDPEIQKAMADRNGIYQCGGTLLSCAHLMGRDDWAVFDVDEITPDQFGLMMMSRRADQINAKDPYSALPVPENKTDTLIDIYQAVFDESNLPFVRDTLWPLADQGNNICKLGAKITVNGEEKTTERAFTYIRENGIENVKIDYKPEYTEKIMESAGKLNANPFSIDVVNKDGIQLTNSIIPGKAVAGMALREDMKQLYKQLDDVNHGLFFSSAEFTKVIQTVKDMSENIYSQQQAEEAFKTILETGKKYIENKSAKEKKSKRDRVRLNAIKQAVKTIDERQKVIDKYHARAENAHNAFLNDLEGKNVDVKSNFDYIWNEKFKKVQGDQEKLLELKAEYLHEKYDISGISPRQLREVDNPINCLSKEKILKKLKDPKHVELHNRAKAVENKLYQFNDEVNAKYTIGLGDPQMTRIVGYFMDLSGTPEAEEHNRLISAAITTEEGCKALFSRLAYEMLTNPNIEKAMTATTMEEALEAFEKDPEICDMAFNSGNISHFTDYLEEPLKTAYEDRINAWQGAMVCKNAVAYLASDAYFIYDDFAFGENSQYQRASDVQQTLRVTHPEMNAVCVSITALSIPVDDAKNMKALGKNGGLKLETQYTDKNGKHLTLTNALAKIAKEGADAVKAETRPNADKLPKQIEAIGVAEPLKIGRKVLDGVIPGATGLLTNEHFNEKLEKIRDIMRGMMKPFPGQYTEIADKSFEILDANKLKENETIDYANAEKRFNAIGKAFQDLQKELPPRKSDNLTEIQKNLHMALTQSANEAFAAGKKAKFVQEHKTYEAENGPYERINGANNFVKEHTKAEHVPALSNTMKENLKEFVKVSEEIYGSRLNNIDEANANKFMKGVANVLVANRLEQEAKKKEPLGKFTQIAKTGEAALDKVCNDMVKEKGFKQICEAMLQYPSGMKQILSNPKMMDDLLDKHILNKNQQPEIQNVKEAKVEKEVKAPDNQVINIKENPDKDSLNLLK